MSDESNTPVDALLERAWATRRRALEADDAERATLLAAARDDLVRAVDASREPGDEPEQVEALHRLAEVTPLRRGFELWVRRWLDTCCILREFGVAKS